MDSSEKRIMGSLFLLSGLTFLSIAIYTDRLAELANLLEELAKIVQQVTAYT
jgi:hypothetical protein